MARWSKAIIQREKIVMRFIKCIIFSWLISIGLVSNAYAQEVTGTIVASIDGDERTWFTTTDEGRSQSDWSGDLNFADISLWGHPVEDTISAIHDSLLIGFQLVKSADGYTLWTIEISFLEDGYDGIYRVVDDADAALTVEAVELDGDQLSLSGSFSATLYYTTDHGREVDMSNSVFVEGNFDTALLPMGQ